VPTDKFTDQSKYRPIFAELPVWDNDLINTDDLGDNGALERMEGNISIGMSGEKVSGEGGTILAYKLFGVVFLNWVSYRIMDIERKTGLTIIRPNFSWRRGLAGSVCPVNRRRSSSAIKDDGGWIREVSARGDSRERVSDGVKSSTGVIPDDERLEGDISLEDFDGEGGKGV
jgi:hypothetical protein